MRNGSMAVLTPEGKQGYDSRLINYDPDLSVGFPLCIGNKPLVDFDRQQRHIAGGRHAQRIECLPANDCSTNSLLLPIIFRLVIPRYGGSHQRQPLRAGGHILSGRGIPSLMDPSLHSVPLWMTKRKFVVRLLPTFPHLCPIFPLLLPAKHGTHLMDLIYYAELLGTMVFAISGTMAAIRQDIDLFGAGFTGFVTAIGGGSLRDIFLNLRPVWVDDGNYLIAILVGVVIALSFKKALEKLIRTFTLFDALGIGFFTVVGVQKSLTYGSHEIAAVVLGMFSAVMGGVIRDTLMNETPLIFRKEIYATACLSGAILFVTLHYFGIDNNINAFISASVIVVIRIVSVKYKLSLPLVGG